ncbi:putative F-box protein [Toxoplasma gondii RUB]|uniref:Putative F-box protein n=1 Tax=Toxoplasma gondii RUB TaxID=935652 RepID=A0A086M9X6_TOXGO|nr:putative F-box protein [Toxoplasma gondii RUB]
MARGANEGVPPETVPCAPAPRRERCRSLAELETPEPLCFDYLLSFLDLRDFLTLSLVSHSLRDILLSDLTRAARCVSGLALHCLCDSPVYPPLCLAHRRPAIDTELPLSSEDKRGESCPVDASAPPRGCLLEQFLTDEGVSGTNPGNEACVPRSSPAECTRTDTKTGILLETDSVLSGDFRQSAPQATLQHSENIPDTADLRFRPVFDASEVCEHLLAAPCKGVNVTEVLSGNVFPTDTRRRPPGGFSLPQEVTRRACAVPLWKALVLVAKGLSVLRVGAAAFGAVPLAMWAHLLKGNAATLREISLSSTLRWESRRQQQHRQRELLDLLCCLDTPSSDVEEALVFAASQLLPKSVSPPSCPVSQPLFPQTTREPRCDPARLRADPEPARRMSQSAAFQACRNLSRPGEDIPLPALKCLAIAWGPCSGLLQLFRRYTCRQCEELQLVVADMPTAACWNEDVENVLDRVGSGGKLRRFRFAVAPKGFVQERSLISWLLSSARDSESHPSTLDRPPKVLSNASWLAALEELSIDTDDPWLLPKAAQLIAAVTRPATQPAAATSTRSPRTGPSARSRGRDAGASRDHGSFQPWGSAGLQVGPAARRDLRSVSEISSDSSGESASVDGERGSPVLAGNPGASKDRHKRQSCGTPEDRRQERGKNEGEGAEASFDGASSTTGLRGFSRTELRPESTERWMFAHMVDGREGCSSSVGDPADLQALDHVQCDTGRSCAFPLPESEDHLSLTRSGGTDGDLHTEISGPSARRFPSLRFCSFRCGSAPASGAGCFSWGSAESLLTAAPPGCALRFHGDILFTTCGYGERRVFSSSVQAASGSAFSDSQFSAAAPSPTEHGRRGSFSRGKTEPVARVTEDAQRRSIRSHGDEAAPPAPTATVRQCCVPSRLTAQRRLRQVSRGCTVADLQPQVCVKGAAFVLREIHDGNDPLDSPVSPSFQAPLRLCCRCRRHPTRHGSGLQGRERELHTSPTCCGRRDRKRISPRQYNVRSEASRSECRDTRFRAHLELPLLRKTSRSGGSEVAAKGSSCLRGASRRFGREPEHGKRTLSVERRCPRGQHSSLSAGCEACVSDAREGSRPSHLFPAVQVQLPNPAASDPSPAGSPSETSPSESMEFESDCAGVRGPPPPRTSTQAFAAQSAARPSPEVSGFEAKPCQKRPREHRLPEWRHWCAEYLSGILDNLPGYCLFLPPVKIFPNGAAHGCGGVDGAPRSENGFRLGSHAGVRVGSRRQEDDGLADRYPSSAERRTAERTNAGSQCCCVFTEGGLREDRGVEERKCVFTLHRRTSRGERQREGTRHLAEKKAHRRGLETWPDNTDDNGQLRPGQPREPCYASISEVGDREPDSVALLAALCLDAVLRQRFRGIALECIFTTTQPPASTSDASESRVSNISSVDISEECWPPVEMLVEHLPDSLRPPLEILRLFVDATATEDAILANPGCFCIGDPLREVFSSPPRGNEHRVSRDICGCQPEKADGSAETVSAKESQTNAAGDKHDDAKTVARNDCDARQTSDSDGKRGETGGHEEESASGKALHEKGKEERSQLIKTHAFHTQSGFEQATKQCDPSSGTALFEVSHKGGVTPLLSDTAKYRDSLLAQAGCVASDGSKLFHRADEGGKVPGSLVSLLSALRRVYRGMDRIEVRVLRGDPGTKIAGKEATKEATEESDCLSCLLSNSARLRALHEVLMSFDFFPVCVWQGQYVFETFVAYERAV